MMIRITTPREAIFGEISRFARRTYLERFDAHICAEPEVFAYVCEEEHIVACLGMYLAKGRDPLLLETYVPAAFERISGDGTVDRDLCAEVGTRAVTHVPGFRSADISLGLSATLFAYAHAQGIRYLAFTSNRTVRAIIRTLDLDLILLGTPDLSNTSQEFQKNWERFFSVKQLCFGVNLRSIQGCITALARLKNCDIHSQLT
jgi:Thermostable hemolysin